MVCSVLNIKLIILLGDFLDMYGLSFYDKDPSFGDLAELYQREIDCGRIRLNELERLRPTKLIYLEGNHEFRLHRQLSQWVPAIRNRITIPAELKLSNQYLWVPYGRFQAYKIPGTDIWTRHKPSVGGSALNLAKQAGDTIIHGDTHQIQEATFRCKVSGKKIRAVSSGWLGDEKRRVFDFVKCQPDWSLAFTLVGANSTIQVVHIEKREDGRYYCQFGDKEFVL